MLEQIMRVVSNAARIPVILALLGFLGFSFFSLGTLLMEAWEEHRHVQYSLHGLLENLENRNNSSCMQELQETIRDSGLPSRHKKLLVEIASHPSFTRDMLESFTDNLLETEQARFDGILSSTSLVARLAPMAGLLGTLIPLGPGLIALSAGDTFLLSHSLLTAFDTTTMGLISAAFCLVIGYVRTRWYTRAMSDLQTLADCVLELSLGSTDSNADSKGICTGF